MKRLVSGVALAASVATTVGVTAAVPASARDWGATGSRDRVLRVACHSYRYHYRVNPPTNDWTLETFLRDPDGRALGNDDFAAESDPRRGYDHWYICGWTTRPGRFTIRAKLTWYNGYDEHVVHLDPSHFRLHRR